MAKIIIDPKYTAVLAALDSAIAELNREKTKLLFAALGIKISAEDFERLMGWTLIEVSVPDRSMAVQLNKLSAYIPNLKFVVDDTQLIFTLRQGSKTRRVWKER